MSEGTRGAVMVRREWAEREAEKLCKKHQYFSEPAIALAFLQEHRRLREQLVLAHRMLLQTNWRDDEEAMGEIEDALDGGKGVQGG